MTSRERPDPDQLLAHVRREAERSTRGKLTIFFGSAPGVGKTYAMLESARFEREEGRDVVVGIVETHGRYDTGALLLGLEILPRRKSDHRGVKLEELDLDAVLSRRPGLVLIDELAHSNAPGSRHAKRWQDVEEILEAGLDVYSTLNVQHLESLNDVVAQITHVIVKETVPDNVFEAADDVRLIDLPIVELLERLHEGKVYVAEQAALARGNFFREGNLIALRELALRLTAQRVDAQMRRYREQHGIDKTWAVAERLLVCVSPSPGSDPLIRGARRLAASLHASLIAAYVETPATLQLSPDNRARIADHMRLAQSLGAETLTLSGSHGAEEITRFARSRNVTRILVGKPTHSRWRDRLAPSFLDQLVRLSGDIDVHVLSGEMTHVSATRLPQPRQRLSAAGIAAAFVMVTASTVLGLSIFPDAAQLPDVVMVYLLAIVLVSLRWGIFPSLAASVLAVLAFDFFFIPPFHTFAVSDVTHIPTFGVMFIVGVVISGLTKRVRDQADAAREREIRTASLYSLSNALSRAETTMAVATAGVAHIHDVFGAKASVLLDENSVLVDALGGAIDDKELGAAEWTLHNGRPAGAGTDTLPGTSATYFPLEATGERLGVLSVHLPELDHARRQHIEAFARQIAGALERTKLADQAHSAQLQIEAEQLRNSLLSSVSHDLRTPLAVITGAASALLDTKLAANARRDLTSTVLSEAERLNRLVRNLLDMTRLEAGAVQVKKEWQPIEETVGAALERVESVLDGHPVKTDVDPELPLVPYDSILVQQVLINLLENAAKYTPAGSEIMVSAHTAGEREVEVVVADRGPGLPAGEEEKVFGKFYRAEQGKGGGVGLGLTICKGIVMAHGGKIWCTSRDGGGAEFHFVLPIEGTPPSIDVAAAS
jgi:two-component system sensor histidine kinase KdpD